MATFTVLRERIVKQRYAFQVEASDDVDAMSKCRREWIPNMRWDDVEIVDSDYTVISQDTDGGEGE